MSEITAMRDMLTASTARHSTRRSNPPTLRLRRLPPPTTLEQESAVDPRFLHHRTDHLALRFAHLPHPRVRPEISPNSSPPASPVLHVSPSHQPDADTFFSPLHDPHHSLAFAIRTPSRTVRRVSDVFRFCLVDVVHDTGQLRFGAAFGRRADQNEVDVTQTRQFIGFALSLLQPNVEAPDVVAMAEREMPSPSIAVRVFALKIRFGVDAVRVNAALQGS